MLSVDKCKNLIENTELTDEEVEEIRNSLYELAELTWDIYKDKKYGSKNPVRLLQDNN